MTAQEDLIALIGDIYQASYRPEHWDTVLTGLCRLLNVEAGGIHVAMPATGVRHRIAHSQAPRIPHHGANGSDDPPEGSTTIAAISLLDEEDRQVGIALHRDVHVQPLSAKERQLLDVLTPHLQRALRIQKNLDQARNRVASLQSALAGLIHGALIISPLDRVTYCNAAAIRTLARHQAVSLHGNRLRAHYQRDAAQLWGMLARLRQGDTRRRAVALFHPDRPQPLIVTAAVHDRNRECSAEIGSEEIILYLSDPDSSFQPSPETLAKVFNFTPTQSNVVIALVNGLSLQDVAEHHGVNKETIRSHLKSIFVKLGVNKQQDVVRLILNSELDRATASFPTITSSTCH